MALEPPIETPSPLETGPSKLLTPAQQEDYKRKQSRQMEDVQKAEVERLQAISSKILDILKEEGVSVQEWDMISKSVYAKINKIIDRAELSKIFEL